VFPKNKYFAIQLPRSKSASVANFLSMFEELLVFTEFFWIGKAEDNPTEEKLDFPEEMILDVERFPNEHFQEEMEIVSRTSSRRTSKAAVSDDEESVIDVDNSELSTAANFGDSQEVSLSRPRRSSALRSKDFSFAEDDENESSEDASRDGSSEIVDSAEGKTSNRKRRASSVSSTRRSLQSSQNHDSVEVSLASRNFRYP